MTKGKKSIAQVATQREVHILRLLASLANIPALDSLQARQKHALKRHAERGDFDWEALVYGHALIHSMLNALVQEREQHGNSETVSMEPLEEQITGKGISLFVTAYNKPMWGKTEDALPEALLVEFRTVLGRDPFPFRRCIARQCGMIFVPQEPRQKYCSVRCRTRGDETRHRKKNAYLRTYMAQRRKAARK